MVLIGLFYPQEHTINIPENFYVTRNASEGRCNVMISWKSDNVENFNNSVMMSFEDDQDNYFIKFVEITHIDNIEGKFMRLSNLPIFNIFGSFYYSHKIK